VDTQERHPPISLNMVVCLNNKDLNQPDRWLTNSQANSKVNKDMLVLQHNPQANTLINRWAMEVLRVLVATAVARSSLRTPNSGVLQQPKISRTALVVTKVDSSFMTRPVTTCCAYAFLRQLCSVSLREGIFTREPYFLTVMLRCVSHFLGYRLGRTA